MNLHEIHNPPDEIQRVLHWIAKAQIDYTDRYLNLYIAYNTWYRQVTATTNDRQAISLLKKRFIIWDDYISQRAMSGLEPIMEQLVDLTQREPLPGISLYWNGEVGDVHDWRSLIEYWYRVRCLLVHGGDVSGPYVLLAYKTLNIFMGEIVRRIGECLKDDHRTEIRHLSLRRREAIGEHDVFQMLHQRLYQKYVAMPDIWQVDMQHSSDTA